MADEKTLRIEIAKENPEAGGYFYSTLALPAAEHEIRDALQKARIGRSDGEYLDITITGSLYAHDLEHIRIDSPTIDELNFLAKRLTALEDIERLIYAAVLPKAIRNDEIVSMKTLINCTYDLDSVMVASNITTDEQIGQFVIDNELNEDVNAVPDEALYLLDRKKIGALQRQMDGGVFIGRYYIIAGDYEPPEIYDGERLPESEVSEWFAFRLKITAPPREGIDETAEESEWITLPIDPAEADAIALKHEVGYIEDCDCIGFESSIPQITEDNFTDMDDFGDFNRLAARMLEMSPAEQIKFKAALEADENSGYLNGKGLLDKAVHLEEYELFTPASDSGEFIKAYLRRHLDTRIDPQWLDTLFTRNKGDELLKRLGASVTDYGVISARGRSLFEPAPYREQETKELAAQVMTDEKLDVIELLGRRALFSNGRLAPEEIPEGLYAYDLREGESLAFATIEPKVAENHGGTILMKAPLDFGGEGYIVFDEDTSPNFLGYELTPQEFMEIDFTQAEDEPEQENSGQIGGMQL